MVRPNFNCTFGVEEFWFSAMKRLSMRFTVCFFLVVASINPLQAQWFREKSNTTERLRAVCAVNDTVAWASGNHGTYVRTTDGGNNWIPARLPGADSLDIRDIEAFDASTAYALSIGPGTNSRIFKTSDGGSHWTLQFVGNDTSMFLDEFAFWDPTNGIVVGDAINGHMLILRTSDAGTHWKVLPPSAIPAALPGEGAFAASGSGITVFGDSDVWIGSGVNTARIYRSTDRGITWRYSATPIRHDSESSGIFSVAFCDENNGVVVGGDYRKENDTVRNVALTNDGGATWNLTGGRSPTGFRSAVIYITKNILMTVGPSGSDLSDDGGRTWKQIDMVGYHAVSKAKHGNAIWAVGENGRISRFRAYLDW
jgi:photosystem II stability/assembly factor-like uncharacterized protein